MKIAVIAPTFIPARRANSVQVMKMAQAFLGAGHDVQVLSPSQREKSKTGFYSLVTAEELARHYGLQASISIDWLPAVSLLRSYDYAVRAVLWARRWGAELIYTRLPQAAALASQSAYPVIYEIHDMPHSRVAVWLLKRFYNGKGARRLVVITTALAKDLESRLQPNKSRPSILVAPDGVDLTRYKNLPLPEEERRFLGNRIVEFNGNLAEQFTAGYTGHLYAGRGTQLILSLAERFPAITFLIAGGEPQDVTKLQGEIQQRGLSNILLIGFVPNAELPLYQAACDTLLMPYQQHVAASSGGDISRYLSPMKMFEYLASGRPIVSSNLPVLQEVLNSENAILLPPEDLEAWAVTLHKLQKNPEEYARMSKQARQDAASYTWEGRVQKILQDL